MKFFIILALVALASANLNYRKQYGGALLSSGSSYGGLSGLSGLSLGGSYGGSSGLALGGGSYGSGLGGGQLAIIQALPVSLASQQVAVSAPALSLGGSYGASYGGSYGAATQQVSGPVYAAVQSTRNVQFVDVASTGSPAAPQSIVIGPSVQPIDIEFQSQSSPVSVRQTHIPGQPNAPQSSSHQEEPDYLKQEIVKPVIHEVTEAIQPYRKITQEVRPVLETINQLITRGQQQQQVVAAAAPVASAQYVSVAQPQAIAVQAQPATVALIAQPVGTVGLSGSQSLGSLSSLGSSYGSLGSSSLGLGSSSLGYGSLSGSTLVSKPSSTLTTSTVGVDNY